MGQANAMMKATPEEHSVSSGDGEEETKVRRGELAEKWKADMQRWGAEMWEALACQPCTACEKVLGFDEKQALEER